jgi:hypothetical protein
MYGLRPNWPAASRVYGTCRTASGSIFHFTDSPDRAGCLVSPAAHAAAHRVAASEVRTQESFFIDVFS